MVPYNLWC